MIIHRFYHELGRYLYAIAISDGVIQEKESKELERIVIHAINNARGPEKNQLKEVIFAQLSFFNCLHNHHKAYEMEQSFISFMMKHGDSIKTFHRQVAIDLIRHLADAYGGVTRKEREMNAFAIQLLESH